MLTLSDVRFGFRTRPDFLGPINQRINPGELWGIIGPNGAGKSTLLRLMAGFHAPTTGQVTLGRDSLTSLALTKRAKQLAFVPQHPPYDLQVTAREVVLMGRFPHRRWGLFETAFDRRLCEQAMLVTETTPFAERSMTTLSGGEIQRVHLAAALAQDTRLFLLDEPTASLDLMHQITILRILRDLTARRGRAVVIVMHDVNLAAQFCTHVLLLSDGQLISQGPPETVIKPDILADVYHLPLTLLCGNGDSPTRWVVPHHGIFRAEALPVAKDGPRS